MSLSWASRPSWPITFSVIDVGWLIAIALLLATKKKKPQKMPKPDGHSVPAPPDDEEWTNPVWLLVGVSQKGRPKPGGKFGTRRPLNRKRPAKKNHAGVDLGAPHMTRIVAPEAGKVVAWQGWDGPGARAFMFQTDRGPAILFGAVDGPSRPPIGKHFEAGEAIAKVGKYPGGGTMLHLEMYRKGQRYSIKWEPYGSDRPEKLLDPTLYVMMMRAP